MTSELHHHHLIQQQQADPYVIYQLRKPHQRGTAVVPRLVPKSHAPAFSHANYRFTRIRAPPADDTSLYLPKSLDYPTNWGSFGSESSIWSGSTATSAFPTRVPPIVKTSTRSKHEDAASSVASITERTSLLSSEGTRSLKSFVRFEQQLHAHLPAPAPVRRPFGEFNDPYRFILPPALSEVEQEDRIVQAAIDDPSSVRSEDIDIDLPPLEPPLREEAIDTVRDFSPTLPNRRSTATPTRQRRSLFSWLFGGGERELRGTRKYADVHTAPIMDEEEEARRREQFVRGADKRRRSNRMSGKRFSWKRSSSVDRNSDAAADRKTSGLGGSAKQLWSKLRRSASFTFGSKKNNAKPKEDKKPEMVGGLQDDPISPNSSFIQRKMASLRETTARRMVATGKKEILIPEMLLERREDRPRPNQLPAGLGAQISATRQSRPTLDQLILARPELGYATSESVEKLANRINSDLSQGTTLKTLTEGSGSLNQFNHFNGDGASSSLESVQAARTKFQTSLVSSPAEGNSMGSFAIVCEEEDRASVSERLRGYRRNSGSTSGELRLSNANKMSLELLRARAAQVPLRPRVANRDDSALAGRHSRDSSDAHEKAYARIEASLRSGTRQTPLQQVSITEMAKVGPSVKERTRAYGRIETTASDGNNNNSELVAMLQNSGSSGKLKLQEAPNAPSRSRSRNRGNKDFNDPHPTALDVYCQCGCTCVYEAECQISCDAKSGKSYKSAKSGGSKRSMDKAQERNLSALTAQSPSLSLLNGAREESSGAVLTEKAWMDAMRRKMELIDEAGRHKEWSERYGRREEQKTSPGGGVKKEVRQPSSPPPPNKQELRARKSAPSKLDQRVRFQQTEGRTGRPRSANSNGIEYHGGVVIQRKRGPPKTQQRTRELSPVPVASRPISTPATSPPPSDRRASSAVEEELFERRDTEVGLVVVEKTRRVGSGGWSILSRLTGK